MEQPAITVLGITVLEPVTTATDILASVVCFIAYARLTASALRRRGGKPVPFERSIVLVRYYFLLMGFATLLGGVVGHGFLYLFSFAWKLPGWITSMVAIMLLERASIEQLRPLISRPLLSGLSVVNIVELATFMLLTLLTLNFRFVEVHSAYGILFVVGSLQLWSLVKSGTPAARTALFAIAWAALSGIIYIGELGISRWFNHYDLSHTVMAVANWVFYRSARRLEASGEAANAVGRRLGAALAPSGAAK